MKEPTQKKTSRSSFYFPQEAVAELEAIRARTVLSNNSDMIRRALQVYDELLRFYEAKSVMEVRSAQGEQLRDDEGTVLIFSPYKNFSAFGMGSTTLRDKTAKKADSTPANFVLSEDATKVLNDLKARTFISSTADVVRTALAAYKKLLILDEKHYMLVIKDKDGNFFEYSPYRPFNHTPAVLPEFV